MSASEQDLAAAHLVRTFRRLGHDERRALQMARGRDYASEAVFVEAVRRGEDEILSVGRVGAFRDRLVSLGISEAEARSQALDHGWELMQEARGPNAGGGLLSRRGDGRVADEGDELVEIHVFEARDLGLVRGSMNLYGGDELSESLGRRQGAATIPVGKRRLEEARKAKKARPAPTASTTAEDLWRQGRRSTEPVVVEPLAEPGGPARQAGWGPTSDRVEERLVEGFKGLGLSDEAAREAAEGRG